MEKERDMVKFMWDECILHVFVRFMYKNKYSDKSAKFNLPKSKHYCKGVLV